MYGIQYARLPRLGSRYRCARGHNLALAVVTLRKDQVHFDGMVTGHVGEVHLQDRLLHVNIGHRAGRALGACPLNGSGCQGEAAVHIVFHRSAITNHHIYVGMRRPSISAPSSTSKI